MDKENLENFFDSEDGVIKEFNGKIRFCIVVLIFFVIYLTLYLLNKITIGSFAFAGISASIPVMLLIILNKFKHKEARDNFYAGYCILTLSVMSWYSAILFSCYENSRIKYVILGYFFVWVFCSIIICFGVLKNIKLNLYKSDILRKQIKINSKQEVYLIWKQSTKLMFAILIFIIIFQMISPRIFMNTFRFDIYFQIVACCFFLLGWMGLFGWKLILKAVLLKKYTL